MLSIVEPFASAEIAYRRERIAADFARANANLAASRRDRRSSAASRAVQRPVHRPARARA